RVSTTTRWHGRWPAAYRPAAAVPRLHLREPAVARQPAPVANAHHPVPATPLPGSRQGRWCPALPPRPAAAFHRPTPDFRHALLPPATGRADPAASIRIS